MIATQLGEMTEREIDRKGIQIPAPIRSVGEYKIPARFVDGVNTTLVVEVVADDASVELNRQMKEAQAQMTEEDTNVLDPSFEDVLAAAEAKIDVDGSEESEDSEESGDAEIAEEEAREDSEDKIEE